MRYAGRIFALVIAAAGAPAMAAGPPARYVDKSAKFSLEIPAGWQRVKLASSELTITLHGPMIDAVTVDLEKTSSNPDPLALAATAIAALKTQPLYAHLETDNVTRASVAGRAGFRAELRSGVQYAWGLVRLRHVLYGVTTDSGTYLIRLQAPAIGYFDRDLAQFEQMVGTFQITGSAAQR